MSNPCIRVRVLLLVLTGLASMLALTPTACSSGDGGGHPTWSKSFGGEGHDELLAASASSDRLVLAGAWNGGIEGARSVDGDLWALSLDGAGNVLWQRALGVRNLPGAGDSEPPTILDLAIAEDGLWLSGVNETGQATVLRTDLDGALVFAVDIEPYEPGRYEQAMAVAPTAGGAVVAIWAYDTVMVTTVGRHPDFPDIDMYEVGRWRLRVVRVDDDGTVRWERTSTELYEDREPQELTITGLSSGGAVVALSLEDTLAVAGYGGDGSLLWSQDRSGSDDAVGAFELPGGATVIYGKSVAFSANSNQGFATRFEPDGEVAWHERYTEVDEFGAGTLACPRPGATCHMVFTGFNLGSIIPPFSGVLRVDLDGDTQNDRRSALWGFPKAVSYDPVADQYLFTVHRWGKYEVAVLDGDLNDVSEAALVDTGAEVGEHSIVASRPGGPIYYYSSNRQLLREYDSTGRVVFTVPLGGPLARREAALSVLASPDGVIATGHDTSGLAWGVRFDASGNLLWQMEWPVPVSARMRNQLAPDQNGAFWFAGDRQLLRIDGQGQPQWRRYMDYQPLLYPASEGVLVLAGQTAASLNSAGAVEWSRVYQRDLVQRDLVRVRLDSAARLDEGWVFAGRQTNGEVLVLSTTEDGAPLSALAIRPSPGHFVGAAHVAVVDERRVVATTFQNEDVEPDALLVALTASDEIAWVRRYGGLLREEVSSLIAPEAGGLLMGGSSSSLGDIFDGWALRLDSEGLVGAEGACQALLTPPAMEARSVDVTDTEDSLFLFDVEAPSREMTSVQPITPDLVIARQCLGSAPDPDPTPLSCADFDRENVDFLECGFDEPTRVCTFYIRFFDDGSMEKSCGEHCRAAGGQCISSEDEVSATGPDRCRGSGNVFDCDEKFGSVICTCALDAGSDGFAIGVLVGGQEVPEGNPVSRGTTITLRADGPGDLSAYEFMWFIGGADDPFAIGEGREITWLLDDTTTFHLVVSQGGETVAEVDRTVTASQPDIMAFLEICPNQKPYGGLPMNIRASTLIVNTEIPLIDHPEVTSIRWTVTPNLLRTPSELNPAPGLTETTTDSIWVIPGGTLTIGAWYDASVVGLNESDQIVAGSNVTAFEVGAVPGITGPRCL